MKKYILLLLLLPNIILGQDELNLIDAIKIGIWENYEIKISKQQKKISAINNNWANAGLFKHKYICKREEVLSDQSKNPASFIQEKLRSTNYNSNANVSWTFLMVLQLEQAKQN